MFKRLFWISIGVGIGAVAVTKAQAYVKANTPDAARQFLGRIKIMSPCAPLKVCSMSSTKRVEPARLNLIPNTRIRSADLIPVTYVRTTITNSFERHQPFSKKGA